MTKNKYFAFFMAIVTALVSIVASTTIGTAHSATPDIEPQQYDFIQLPEDESVTTKNEQYRCNGNIADDEAMKTLIDADKQSDFQSKASRTINYDNVRCLLTTGNVTTVTLTLFGQYYIQENGYIINGSFSNPHTLTLSTTSTGVKASLNDTTIYQGASFTLKNTAYETTSQMVRLNTAGFDLNDGRYYLGDITVSKYNRYIRLINTLPTAFYLYGIVPYEMSESCSIEALKAQAVAAKTFAFAFTLATADYEITDSMTYQGYRGYQPNYSKCLTACLDVCGKMLHYNGKPAVTYYAATNGGETALPSWLWGSTYQDNLYSIKLDEVDLTYQPQNYIQTLHIEYGKELSNEQFKALVEQTVCEKLNIPAFSLTSIEHAAMDKPRHEGSLRDLTELKLDVRGYVSEDSTEHACDITITPEKLKEAGIFTKPFKIYWGKETDGGYDVLYCRWGHGLGLSQYAAEMRARNGAKYTDILEFYYDKMNIATVREKKPSFVANPIDNTPTTPPATPSPTNTPKPTNTPTPTTAPTVAPTIPPTAVPTATPQPTVLPTSTPVPTNPPVAEMPNAVTNGTITSSLSARMRSDASTGSTVIASVPSGATVTVIGGKNEWIQCRYKTYTGYIRGDLLTVEPAFSVGYAGTAQAAKTAVLRNKPSSYGGVQQRIPTNQAVWVYGRVGDYFFVKAANHKLGFVKITDLKGIAIYPYGG